MTSPPAQDSQLSASLADVRLSAESSELKEDNTSPLELPSADFKARGNAFFKAGDFSAAAEAYSDGLSAAATDKEKLLLHLNRAQAHLLLDKFGSALRDADTVLSLLSTGVAGPSDAELKATLRRARALEGMRLLPAALEGYGAVLKLDPKNKDVKADKARVEKMLHEARTGEFDWLRLEKEANAAQGGNKLRRVKDVGDFVGPVRVAQLEGRGGGRGVVATRKIEVGEVLLVEKVFAVGEAPRSSDDNSLLSRARAGFEDAILAQNIAARIEDDPSSAPSVFALHGGERFPPSGEASLDSFSKRKLGTVEEVKVDHARILAIVKQNRFGLEPATATGSTVASSGLFLAASFFNHSCAPNALWIPLGDLFVVRARTSIRAGQEVYLPYTSASTPFHMRKTVLGSHFESSGCNCPRCAADAADGPDNLERRVDLLNQVRPIYFQRDLQSLIRLVDALEKTYSPTRRFPKTELVEAYHDVAELVGIDTDAECRLANSYELKALSASGVVLKPKGNDFVVAEASFDATDQAIRLLVVVACSLFCSKKRQDRVMGKGYFHAATVMSRVLFGDGEAEFRWRFKEFIKKLEIEMLVDLEFGRA
ncbi:hypothetical protein JCM6882_007954 [Rhodosporidiobolus microsporus]